MSRLARNLQFRIAIICAIVWPLAVLISFYKLLGPYTWLIVTVIGLTLVASDFIPSKTHAEKSITIHAPMKVVFELEANYQRWSEFNPNIDIARLLDDQGSIRTLEIKLRNGTKFRETQQIFADSIEEKINERKVKGRELWSYETVTEGTRVTVKADVTARGIYEKFKVVDRVETNMGIILAAQKKIAESGNG